MTAAQLVVCLVTFDTDEEVELVGRADPGTLGYPKHNPAGRGTTSSRKDSTPKTVHTEVSPVTVDTPGTEAARSPDVDCLMVKVRDCGTDLLGHLLRKTHVDSTPDSAGEVCMCRSGRC